MFWHNSARRCNKVISCLGLDIESQWMKLQTQSWDSWSVCGDSGAKRGLAMSTSSFKPVTNPLWALNETNIECQSLPLLNTTASFLKNSVYFKTNFLKDTFLCLSNGIWFRSGPLKETLNLHEHSVGLLKSVPMHEEPVEVGRGDGPRMSP